MIIQRIIHFFPLGAVFLSLVAYWMPEMFVPLQNLIVPLLGFIMLCMGATLSIKDFLLAIKKPKAVIIGVLLQFLLMPLLACGIGVILGLPKEQYIGLVMVGTVAGGTASNVITYLAKGDVALSITMTACSTLAGIILTPLMASLYLGTTVDVPVGEMFKSIFIMVALPVSLGLVLHILLKKHLNVLNVFCPLASVFGILFVITIIVSLNVENLRNSGWIVLVAVALHNTLGMACGFGLSRLLRHDRKTSITIAIEVGMQNSGLASALATKCFSTAAALPGAVFSIWHNISGAIFATYVNQKEFDV